MGGNESGSLLPRTRGGGSGGPFRCHRRHCVQQVLGKGQRQAKFLSYLPGSVSSKLVERTLTKAEHHADTSDMFLYKTSGILVCPYDDRGRLAGEEVWEPDSSTGELIKLDPGDVLTTEEAAKLLAPLIKPLPSFDEAVLQRKGVAR